MERLAPGRWGEVREPSRRELRLTTLMSLKLEEVVAKSRSGAPVDDDADYGLPVWAGVLPLERSKLAPVADERLPVGVEAPEYLSAFRVA